MTRIARPLDPAAVRAADDALYAKHAGDPRPNALFDEAGHRQPLDATDPDQAALRQEWCQTYQQEKAAQGGGGEAAAPAPAAAAPPPAAAAPPSDCPVGSPVQGCPKTHKVAFSVVAAPDAGARKAWWPARPPEYAGVPFSADLPDGRKEGTLGGAGEARFDGIPAGSCRFTMAKFYEDVEAALKPA